VRRGAGAEDGDQEKDDACQTRRGEIAFFDPPVYDKRISKGNPIKELTMHTTGKDSCMTD
jgi:hypothetical protein